MQRISWDEYFMAQSHLLSLRSTCSRLSVGATIVKDKRIVSGGYNGSIKGDEHCIDVGCKVVEGHCVRTIHAEINAILQCSRFGVGTEGATIYVTHFPCLNCTKTTIPAGIKEICDANDYRNNEYARELLEKSGIIVRKVDYDVNSVVERLLDNK